MPRDGRETRTHIMDAAEGLILEQGYAATSIDQLIERVGITKGAFFYHYKTKADLAYALVARYAEHEAAHVAEMLGRADGLSRDPVQRLLIFVGLLVEEVSKHEEPYPGCLFASYCYEGGLFNDETHGILRDSIAGARALLADRIGQAAAHAGKTDDIDAEALADMFTVIFEGAFIVSRILAEPKVTARQLALYRDYLERILTT